MRIAVTRREYDAMVHMYPLYMTTTWLRMQRNWCVGGCMVTCPSQSALDELQEKRDTAGA